MATHTYPIRLDNGLYERLRARAQKEGCTIADLLRAAADLADKNPPISVLLSTMCADLVEIKRSSEANRAALVALVGSLKDGKFDRRRQDPEERIGG